MLVCLRTIDDGIITVSDVDMLAAYESVVTFEDCKLINVSILRNDGETSNYYDICDLEVF